MTGKQNAVMWLGLLLVTVRLFTTGQWSAIWDVAGTKVPEPVPAGSSGSSQGNSVSKTIASIIEKIVGQVVTGPVK